MPAKQPRLTDEALVPVRIAYGELEFGKMARKLGGKWDPGSKVWYIKYGNIKGTVLEAYLILDVKKIRKGIRYYMPHGTAHYVLAYNIR